ncbi:MAG: hypothetical protein GY796_21865, partial [Chloroflexi bacterium]|nr:hypothetical protein [Chloroflexota bacterium]
MNSVKSEYLMTEPAVERPSKITHIQSPGRSLAVGLALGIMADVLLFGKPLRVGGHSAILPPLLLGESVDMDVARQYGRRGFFPVIRGILIAAPVL